ncbi:radical SAM protein [Pelagibaculum spongiae]|uniref:Radical SAM protein n=1 Tax=Pelagibaculum spongiae TaxID=2080658 RepID=A0A2V1GX62_9GAMM|nr:radical SAM protein [Pelagibaculum spongiae]PVZ64373.1 radical SAM protein [Pelagibaculum spongiae]
MQTIKTKDWFFTPNGDPRGYIDAHGIKELWFHTGTACNLECPFCFEGSKPGDNRLQLIKFDDAKPFIDEAIELDVQQFSFTGGEPFLAKDLVKILEYAADARPCLVLTNGTDALLKRIDQLNDLAKSKHPVSFRVSIDFPDEKQHDLGRGEGNFDKALQGLKALFDLGFHISVARQMKPDENAKEIEQAFADIFQRYGLPTDLHLVAFPDFLLPGAHAEVPYVTQHCMTTYQNEQTRQSFMCAFSKMVVKDKGEMRVYACTLVDDDPDYDQGGTLKESLEQRISMKHHRCFSCFKFGSSCSEM